MDKPSAGLNNNLIHKNMKIKNNVKVVAVLLACCFFRPVTASAFNDETYWDILVDGIGYWFNEDGNTVSICANSKTGASYSGAFTVPESITYEGKQYPVTGVGEYAFAECGELVQVDLPASITEIGARAFNECPNLVNVKIPANVSHIGDYAFNGCGKLGLIVCLPLIPPSLGSYVFSGVDKSKVMLSVPMHFVEEYKEISTHWTGFGAYDPLKYDAVVDGVYYSIAGYYSDAQVCANFKGSEKYTGDIVVPDKLEFFKGTAKSCSFTVNEVLENAFKNSGINSLTLPATVKTVGKDAFNGCRDLKECHLAGVEYINERAFYDTALERVYMECDDTHEIQKEAFAKSGGISLVVCKSYYHIPALAENAFDENVYAEASLEVPKDSIRYYNAADGWKKFIHIGTVSGIRDIEADASAPEEYFNLQGVKVDNPENGIFIRRQGGKANKVKM